MATQNFSTVSPGKAARFIARTFLSKFTARDRICLHGLHGSGKTQSVAQAAAIMAQRFTGGVEVIHLHLLNLDLGSFRGLEHVTDAADGTAETRPARPHFLPPYIADEDITDATPRYVLFLDEIMAADDAIRKSGFEILTEHRCGPHRLGSNVYVLAAGNSSEEGAIVYPMDWPTRDRLVHVRVEQTQEGILDHATRMDWHHHVITLIRNNIGCYKPSEIDYENDNLAAPSSRSLESASNTLKSYDAGEMDDAERDVSLKGKLGNGLASILIQSIEDEEARFDLQKLMTAERGTREYPKNAFGLYSLGNAMATLAKDEDTLDLAIDIMCEIPGNAANCGNEVKTLFFNNIGPILIRSRKLPQYSIDERVSPFLLDTMKEVEDADREYEKRQAMQSQEAA